MLDPFPLAKAADVQHWFDQEFNLFDFGMPPAATAGGLQTCRPRPRRRSSSSGTGMNSIITLWMIPRRMPHVYPPRRERTLTEPRHILQPLSPPRPQRSSSPLRRSTTTRISDRTTVSRCRICPSRDSRRKIRSRAQGPRVSRQRPSTELLSAPSKEDQSAAVKQAKLQELQRHLEAAWRLQEELAWYVFENIVSYAVA
ncbi:hypothetical protein PLICRDRAFT_171776 [Plicaturopsis crispa FD-325 SS-3]|nr:hypothetical protein PLICRDRAFT_171776 [Plicaturopsis crispa FD-325 SS-3]